MKFPSNIKLNIFAVLAIMFLGILTVVLAIFTGAFGIALMSLCGLLATGSVVFVGHWFKL